MLSVIESDGISHLPPVPTIKIKIKPKRPPPPPPIPPPPQTSSILMSAFRRIEPRIKNPSYSCRVCEGFLLDWLLLPRHSEDPWNYIVKSSVLKRIAPQIAKDIHRLVMSMTPIHKYVITNTVTLRLKVEEKNKKIRNSKEVNEFEALAWATIVKAVMNQRGEGEIKHIQALIQDSGMIRHESDGMLWIGYVLWEMWDELQSIHLEHQGKKPTTAGGPAFGLVSYPNIHAAVAAPPKKETTISDFEMESLYW
jgi:hypothetical protein